MKKLVLILLIVTQISALRIDRAIIAADTNPEYLEFWPIVAKAWKEIVGVKPTLALIASKDTPIDDTVGEVIRFEPIMGVSLALQAQAIRLLLPAYFEEEGCIISDIDMIPLNKEYFIDSAKIYTDDSFLIYRDRAYVNEKKFPMCYVAAKGKVFKEIFEIGNIEDIPNIIKKWSDDNLGWYTDEFVLYKYVTNWRNFNTKCSRLGHTVELRIDRSYWNYSSETLNNGHYVDAHCPRPYSKYKHEIDNIVDVAINSSRKKQLDKFNQTRSLNSSDYGTHMVPLLTAVLNTNGPVFEMGAGDYSTTLLHSICSVNKRFLLTTDTDKKWLNTFIDLANDWHIFQYIPVYEDDYSASPKPYLWDNVGSDIHWSVVFIDHRPGERRVQDIRRLRNNTDIFVVHDTQQPSYCYDPVLNSFKYKYTYKRYSTYTTIVSDKIDIVKMFEN